VDVALDGTSLEIPARPIVAHVAAGTHTLMLTIKVSPYERRIACGYPVRVGTRAMTTEGLGELTFASPYGETRGSSGGRAVVFVPPGHDATKPAAVLMGLYPWNGTLWTYAAYTELLAAATSKDVVLLMPSGLGNSLYTADAEDEAMRALDALASVVAVDPRRVSVWGASMGGAGATTIGLHHPDRFASITSFFGDSQYDLTTYVRHLLHDQAGAHAVNALDVVDNARWVPTWLIHGEADATSPIRQSELLASAMQARGFPVTFTRAERTGHSGALVAMHIVRVVDLASTAQVPAAPSRVTFRSVRPWDAGAYGVHLARSSAPGDAFVDIERTHDGATDVLHLHKADGVSAVALDPGALGTDASHPPALANDTGHAVELRWTPAATGGP
jgi:pimeloyl-ACP methyl ester carboxylesterase